MPDLSATYSSPSAPEPHTMISVPLPAISPSPPTEDRVAYLAELQKAVRSIQGDINIFLTQKMEEDKAIAGDKAKMDDAHEEEHYGEEVVEGD